MRTWTHVETREIDQFTVILDWCYEDLDLSYVFEDPEDIKIHAERCNQYIDTHYVARVRVFYDGVEMGSSYMGSCYAYGVDPAVDMVQEECGGYLEQMLDEAMDEARGRAVEMLDRLKADFLS